MAEGNRKAVVLSDVHVPTPAAQRGITGEAWNALKNSVYRGASDAMILLAVDYCKARKYDPLMKPVHIVKTWDGEANGGKGGMVEGIWPGINLHRTTASRSGIYAGQDDPEFGPMVTRKLGPRDVTFPDWCKIRVYKMVEGQRVPYTGMVFFEEAFAKVRDGGPNSMWTKRPRGQLAKCAEAEALRKAFPEETGGEATAEEMDGAHIGPDNAKDVTPAELPKKLDALEELIDAVKPEPAPHDPDSSSRKRQRGPDGILQQPERCSKGRHEGAAEWCGPHQSRDAQRQGSRADGAVGMSDDISFRVGDRVWWRNKLGSVCELTDVDGWPYARVRFDSTGMTEIIRYLDLEPADDAAPSTDETRGEG